jgi:hypothetical protein
MSHSPIRNRVSNVGHSDGKAAGIAFNDVIRSRAEPECKHAGGSVLNEALGTKVFCSVCCDERLASCRRAAQRLQLAIYRIKLRLLFLELALHAVNSVRKVLRYRVGSS